MLIERSQNSSAIGPIGKKQFFWRSRGFIIWPWYCRKF